MLKATVRPNDGEKNLETSQRPKTDFGSDARLMHEANLTLIGQGADQWHFAQLAHNSALCREVIELIQNSQQWINVVGEPFYLEGMPTFHPFDAFDCGGAGSVFCSISNGVRELIFRNQKHSHNMANVQATTVQVSRLRIEASIVNVMHEIDKGQGVVVEPGHVWTMLRAQQYGSRGRLACDKSNVFVLEGLKHGERVMVQCDFNLSKFGWEIALAPKRLKPGTQIITAMSRRV